MKSVFLISAAAVMLVTGPVFAGHCDNDVSDVEQAIATAWDVDSNAVEAAEALLDHAIVACDLEATEAANDLDSPINDPDYVSMGRSMLFSALDGLNSD